MPAHNLQNKERKHWHFAEVLITPPQTSSFSLHLDHAGLSLHANLPNLKPKTVQVLYFAGTLLHHPALYPAVVFTILCGAAWKLSKLLSSAAPLQTSLCPAELEQQHYVRGSQLPSHSHQE